MIKSQMEVEEENIVNRLQRQIEMLLANYKALEAGLEARGINIKELGTGPLTVDRSTEWVYGRSPTKSGDLRRSGELLSEFLSSHPLLEANSLPQRVQHVVSCLCQSGQGSKDW